MHTIVVGVNYKSAPVEIREKLAFDEEQLPAALAQLRSAKSIMECVILSTCNRTELYVVADQIHTGRHFTKTFLANWFSINKDELTSYLTIKENDHAVEHLFRVACGLDSMVIGETQILGQAKQAFQLAQSLQVTGTVFNQLFKQAITLGKRAHSTTAISSQAVSVSYAGVELGKKIFGSFEGKRVLIVGAGEMSELTAKHIHANGAASIVVMNRSLDKAEALANQFNGEAVSFQYLTEQLKQADVVISSTGAREFVLTQNNTSDALQEREDRPLFIIDIAVPRDVDPVLNEWENVHIYDIDHLQHIVESNKQEREKEAEKISLMIEEEIVEYNTWVNTLGVVPIITALRGKALQIQGDTMSSIERKLPHLTERELKVLRKHTKSIVNQLLRDPLTKVKELAAEPDAQSSLQLFTDIFALEESLEEQKDRERQSEMKALWRQESGSFTELDESIALRS
ncbi:glutamyl-tRNA reductase [Shouchella sp. JSM 1781072]|uniref:glutamyl-tRNA reductase n=1 Tax=Bacillaceae TaxID=186817 RepID=UPI000C0796C4|nr:MULTISPECIES: glutamyl-tRNA reductase [Bacillaceae]UTR05109.1 glutamyl-tRNA reductase [Alkalihalobacillus sp. LMS6]